MRREHWTEPAMTFEEIAKRMGKSVQNVRNAYERGMQKLRAKPEVLKKLVALSAERQKLLHKDFE